MARLWVSAQHLLTMPSVGDAVWIKLKCFGFFPLSCALKSVTFQSLGAKVGSSWQMDMDSPPGDMAACQKNARAVSAVRGRQDWSRQSIISICHLIHIWAVCVCVRVRVKWQKTWESKYFKSLNLPLYRRPRMLIFIFHPDGFLSMKDY